MRGNFKLDARSAEAHAAWTERAKDLDLLSTIRIAFKEMPVIMAIYENPGISSDVLRKKIGNGGGPLVIGHTVYKRLGFFRKFIDEINYISDLLFDRSSPDKKVRYRLKPEAEQVFIELGALKA